MTSPLEIMIGLHYWTTPTEYSADDEAHRSSDATRGTLDRFVAIGLLTPRQLPNPYGGTYKATDALGVWVEALCAVPLPVQKWVIPEASALPDDR